MTRLSMAVVVALAGCSYPEFAFAPTGGADSTVTTADVLADTAVADSPDSTVPETSEETLIETLEPNDTGVVVDSRADADADPVVDTAPVFVTLLSKGATWRYLDTGIAPSSSNWRGSGGFDDSAWKSGLAELGYGDGDEKTVVYNGADASPSDGDADTIVYNHFTTTYFRRFITVTGAAGYDQLTFRLLRDDGAVVYLNGSEVVRTNMPSGAVSGSTFASTSVSGTDEDTFYSFTVPAATLKEGANVIAVEIHQAYASSSDISFDLEVVGRKP